jgi:hypothetical protein
MVTAQRALATVATLAASDDGDLLRIVVNAASVGEAHLAVGILADRVEHRTLVSALNVREILRELPASPFAMRVDAMTLARTADLMIERGSLRRIVTDTDGGYEVVVLAEGNLCFEILVVADGESVFVRPTAEGEYLVHPEALELILSRGSILDQISSLVKAMGIVFNPTFYLSLEDWTREYAEAALSELSELF